MMTRPLRIALAACILAAWASVGVGDTLKSTWDSGGELLQWIAVLDKDSVRLEQRTEGERTFVRATPATGVALSLPNDVETTFSLASQPAILDPRTHNAVVATMRHTMPVDEFGGCWLHRSGEYDEDMANVPFFEVASVPGDGQWHEVTLRLLDSPYVDLEDDVVLMRLGPTVPRRSGLEELNELVERLRAVPATAYLDVDRIEFVQLSEPAPPSPVITAFHPARARWLEEVTIEGSGFASPPERNVVLFDDVEAEVVRGDSSSLTVKATSSGTVQISVRTPGGGLAVAQQPFVLLRPPSQLEAVAGDAQEGSPGAVLEPMSVRVGDGTHGIPGERVTFRVAEGEGVLSATEVTTDDDGIASTVLTLGASPGTVTVEASAYGLTAVSFTARAVP